MINLHVKNGFRKWGFVVLRGVYDNDAEWNTFISLYKANVADELHGFGLEDELVLDSFPLLRFAWGHLQV